MSGAPRTSKADRRDRPRASRIVLRTLLMSAIVIAAGYGTGQLLGRVLL